MDKLLQFVGLIIICALLGGLFWFYGTTLADISAISELATGYDLEWFLATGAAIGAVLGVILVLRR